MQDDRYDAIRSGDRDGAIGGYRPFRMRQDAASMAAEDDAYREGYRQMAADDDELRRATRRRRNVWGF